MLSILGYIAKALILQILILALFYVLIVVIYLLDCVIGLMKEK